MFARYFVELPSSPKVVEATLTAAPETWLPGIAGAAHGLGDRLLADVGFGDRVRVDRTVEVSVGEPVRAASKTVIPISWTPVGTPEMLPSMDADLEVAPLGDGLTQLAISARYEPPLGALGRAIDRAVLHRVAEATIKDFLDRVAERIRAETAEPTTPSSF
jgi:hypothetical protein